MRKRLVTWAVMIAMIASTLTPVMPAYAAEGDVPNIDMNEESITETDPEALETESVSETEDESTTEGSEISESAEETEPETFEELTDETEESEDMSESEELSSEVQETTEAKPIVEYREEEPLVELTGSGNSEDGLTSPVMVLGNGVNAEKVYLGPKVLYNTANLRFYPMVRFGSGTWDVMGYRDMGVVYGNKNTLNMIREPRKSDSPIQFGSSIEYSGSNLETEINRIANNELSSVEKASIRKRDLKGGCINSLEIEDGIAGPDVNDAVLWPLTAANMFKTYFDICDDCTFWTCSPGSDENCIATGKAVEDADLPYDVFGQNYSETALARPACSVDLSRVLLTSKVGSNPHYSSQCIYKLTLLDDNIVTGIQSGKKVELMLTTNGVRTTVPYVIDIPDSYNADNVKLMVSVIDDKDEAGRRFLYYGQIDLEDDPVIESKDGHKIIKGTGEFVLPDRIDSSLVDRYSFSLNAVIEGGDDHADGSSDLTAISRHSITHRANPIVSFNTVRACKSSPSDQEVPMGGKAQEPDELVAQEAIYEFDGWYDNSKYLGGEFDFDTPIEDDLTLYAKWKRRDTTVIFYWNNGTEYEYDRVKVPYDSRVSRPTPDPTCEGYVFSAWFKDAECTNVYNFNDSVTSDVLKLYAGWRKKCTVTFGKNQGTGSMTAAYLYQGDYYTAPECGFTAPSGQRFREWYYSLKDINGEDHIYTAKPGDQLLFPIKDDLILYAQWELDTKYTITFNKNGHGTAPEPITVNSMTIAEKPDDPTDAVYEFAGWYTDKTYGADKLNSRYLFDFTKPVSKNITLYAGWRHNDQFTVSFSNEAAGIKAETDKTVASYGDTITVTLTPLKDYYAPGQKPTNSSGPNTLVIGGVPYWNDSQNKYGTKYVRVNDLVAGEGKWTYSFELLESPKQEKDVVLTIYSHKTDAHTHIFEFHPEIAPTCTEPGVKGWCICSECGYRFEYYGEETDDNNNYIPDDIDFDAWAYIPPTNHHDYPNTAQSAVTHIEAKPATCNRTGYKECYYCDYCKKYFSDEECTHEIHDAVIPIDPDAHSYEKYPVMFTFSDDYTELYARKTCDNACAVAMWEKVDVTVTNYTAPTCETAGSITLSPGHFENEVFENAANKPAGTESIPALGHNYRDDYAWDTDTDPYSVTGTRVCTRCKDISVTEKVNAKKETAGNHIRFTAEFESADLYDQVMDAAELSFDLNGEPGEAPKTQIILEGDIPKMPKNPVSDERAFEGWYTDPDCSAESRFDFSDYVTENTVLFAKWGVPATYCVDFNLNGHGEPIDSLILNKGNIVDKPKDPEAEGYIFAGWFIDTALTVPYAFGSEITSDMTLNAKWVPASKGTVRVEFNMGGYGSEIPEQIIEKGKKPVKPADPIDEEKVFAGWFTDSSFTTEYNFKQAVNSDTIVFAKWAEPDPDGFYAYFDIKKDTLTYNSGMNRYEHIYTAGKITPLIVVKDFGGRSLKEGVDYTIKYRNNQNVDKKGKPAIATITGKGNYKGSKKLLFYVTPKSLGSGIDSVPAEGITLCDIVVKSGAKVAPVLYYNGKKLASKDYKLTSKTGSLKITDADDVSNLYLTITGKGNYSGTIKEAKINRLTKQEIAAGTIKVSLNPSKNLSLTYNGKDQTLKTEQLIVKSADGTKTLTPGTDYDVVYTNNRNVGTAKVTVSGRMDKGYTGSVVKTFKITPDKNTSTITVTGDEEVTYVKGGAKPAVTVTATCGGVDKILTEGKDYKITYKGNTKVNPTASYTVAFIGNYKGQAAVTRPLKVNPAPFDVTHVSVKASDMIYGKPGKYLSKLYVTYDGVLLTNREYDAAYKIGETDITKVSKYTLTDDSAKVTVILKGKGNYAKEEITVADCYSIKHNTAEAIDLSKARITMKGNPKKGIPAQSYTGYEIRPEFDIYIKVGSTWVTAEAAGLTLGMDYEYTYMNNTAKGTATILVKAIDGSTKAVKSKTATFKIGQRTLANLFQLFRW